jgi:hypothetical protein
MDVFENSSDISFTLDTHNNIIAVVKAGARVKVLSELPAESKNHSFSTCCKYDKKQSNLV